MLLAQDLKHACFEVYYILRIRLVNGYFNNNNYYTDMDVGARGAFILRNLSDIIVYSLLFVAE